MTLINVGAFTGNALSPQLLDVAGGSFPNLFLFGAAFQALVLVVLLQIKDEPKSTPPESIVIQESE